MPIKCDYFLQLDMVGKRRRGLVNEIKKTK